jgi:hypothetical protein
MNITSQADILAYPGNIMADKTEYLNHITGNIPLHHMRGRTEVIRIPRVRWSLPMALPGALPGDILHEYRHAS